MWVDILLILLSIYLTGHYLSADFAQDEGVFTLLFIGAMVGALFYRQRGLFGYGYNDTTAPIVAFIVGIIVVFTLILVEAFVARPLRSRRRSRTKAK